MGQHGTQVIYLQLLSERRSRINACKKDGDEKDEKRRGVDRCWGWFTPYSIVGLGTFAVEHHQMTTAG